MAVACWPQRESVRERSDATAARWKSVGSRAMSPRASAVTEGGSSVSAPSTPGCGSTRLPALASLELTCCA
eukprot:3229832-Prymnesium_polylepis.2